MELLSGNELEFAGILPYFNKINWTSTARNDLEASIHHGILGEYCITDLLVRLDVSITWTFGLNICELILINASVPHFQVNWLLLLPSPHVLHAPPHNLISLMLPSSN